MPKFFNIFGSSDSTKKQAPVNPQPQQPQPAPEPIPDYYIPGKYAVENTYYQPLKALAGTSELLKVVSPDLSAKGLGLYSDALMEKTELIGEKNKQTMAYVPNHTFPLALKGNILKKTREGMLEMEAALDKIKKNPTPNTQPIMGYLNFLSKCFDQKNNFTDAVWDNPFLENMIAVTAGMPKISNNNETLANTFKNLTEKEVDGKVVKGPLPYLNGFFNGAAELFDREYERLQLAKNPERDIMGETLYLKNLNNTYKKIIENYDHLAEMIDDEGKSPFDGDMYNNLDQIVGKSVKEGSVSNRSSREQIAYMRGCQHAIDMGWDMNELGVLGHVSLMEKYIELIDKKNKEAVKTQKNVPTPEDLQRYEDFKKDVTALKEKVWNVNAKSMSNKAMVMSDVEAFNEKYKDYKQLQASAFAKTVTHNFLGQAKREINTILQSKKYDVNEVNFNDPQNYTWKDGKKLDEAMQKGWTPEFMPVMFNYFKLKEEVEKAINNEYEAVRENPNYKKNDALIEWEKKQFRPLKEFIENKKIEHPADVLTVMEKMETFRSTGLSGGNAGAQIIKKTLDKEPAKTNMQILWNKAIGMHIEAPTNLPKNEAKIKEYKNLSFEYDKKEFLSRSKDKEIRERSIKTQLLKAEKQKDAHEAEQLKADDVTNEKIIQLLGTKKKLSYKNAESLITKFMDNKFKAALTQGEGPEFNNPNDYDYKAYKAAVGKEIALYSKRVMKSLKLSNPKENNDSLYCEAISQILQDGNHDSYKEQIRDKAIGKVKLNQLQTLQSTNSVNASFESLSGYNNLKDVKKCASALKSAESARKELEQSLGKKFNEAITTKNPNHTIVDQKKLKTYITKQNKALVEMTNAVNKLQQKNNNGGLTDVEKNALEALKNAGKECLKIYDMALSLNRTPFQMKHFNTLKNGGYLVDDKKFAQIAKKANQEAKVKDVKINDTDEMMKKATTTKAMKL